MCKKVICFNIMKTLREALQMRLRCPDDKLRYEKFIKEIYASIGKCKDCISRTEEGGCEIYESLKPIDDWYCADWEKRK